MERKQIYELPLQDLEEPKPQMVGYSRDNPFPKGMGKISIEEILKNLMRKEKPEPEIRGFSIDNVNSDEEYQKVVEGYLDWLKNRKDLPLIALII